MQQPSGNLQARLVVPFLGVAVVAFVAAVAMLAGTAEPSGWQLALGLSAVLCIAAGVAWYSARGIAQPLGEVRRRAEAMFEGGSLTTNAATDIAEIAALSDAVRRMMRQLDDRVQEATERRRELEIVLNSMVEGFLAVNENETVFKVNAAACHMLDIDPGDAFGRDIREFIRSPEFHRFVEKIIRNGQVERTSVTLRTARGVERELEITGSAIVNDEGKSVGALFVMDDVTQLRQLETMRRDFVANVSHELKTPITSIKGFTETLLDGAIDDRENAHRFLDIISRQSDRLSAIIEDLLSLARIERLEEANAVIDREPTRLLDIIEAARESCSKLAETQRAEVEIDPECDVVVNIEASLFQQAVTNLINNAIKYSPAGGRVRVATRRLGSQIAIDVSDQGPGIPAEHIPRLFERFYRIDTSRSRELGGTGLGLAIVKHIAQIHGGDIRVESVLDQGSTFTLTLPQGDIDQVEP